jgi:hypothetical protein
MSDMRTEPVCSPLDDGTALSASTRAAGDGHALPGHRRRELTP